jgi:hypothetical protein
MGYSREVLFSLDTVSARPEAGVKEAEVHYVLAEV